MGELLGAAAWAGKIYSGGWVDGGGHTFASVEPATGRQLADVGSAAPDDVRRAVQRASDAQRSWAATPYDRRATVLRRAAELLAKHQDELEDWVVREAGLPRYFAGALGAAEEFHQAAALAALHWVRFFRRCSPGCRLRAAGPWVWSASSRRSTLP